MKKLLLIVLLIFSLLTLTGCGNDYGELEGTVVDKKYDSGGVVTTMTYNGRSFIPHMLVVPESWNIKLEKEVDRRDKIKMDRNI